MGPGIWTIQGKLEDPRCQATTGAGCARSTQPSKATLIATSQNRSWLPWQTVPNPVRPDCSARRASRPTPPLAQFLIQQCKALCIKKLGSINDGRQNICPKQSIAQSGVQLTILSPTQKLVNFLAAPLQKSLNTQFPFPGCLKRYAQVCVARHARDGISLQGKVEV